MNTGDIAWILLASALVLLMTPGLALFYGGLSRSKNAAGTIMHSFMCMGIVGVSGCCGVTLWRSALTWVVSSGTSLSSDLVALARASPAPTPTICRTRRS